DRTSSSPSASVRSGEKAAAIRHTLDGIWVNTMVLMRPIRPAIRAATGWEKALNTPAQKKNTLAADRDSSNFSNSHSARRDWTMKPPANASRLNSAASLYTTWREGPNGATGRDGSAKDRGSRWYMAAAASPSTA